jgi:uncharacterized membrane protein
MTLSGRGALVITIGAVISLCINLFLAGLMAGGMWHERMSPWRPGPMGFEDGPNAMRPGDRPGEAARPGGMMVWVPPEIREQMKDILAPHEAEIEQMRKAMRAARLDVAKQLAADPLNPDGLKQALDNLQQRSAAMQQLMHNMMLEAAPKLSPELRQRWAERWQPKPRPAPPPPDQD